MIRWVLDASAVLALLRGEPGADIVDEAISSSILSAVNASEVMAKLIAEGASSETATQTMAELACDIVAVDAGLGLRAGALHASTRHNGLSLGDRICLALAEREGLPALTADRAWAELSIDIDVSLIR